MCEVPNLQEAIVAACVHVPRLRLARAHHRVLQEGLYDLDERYLDRNSQADVVAFLMARDWCNKAAGYLDNVMGNLVHSPQAFAQIEATITPALVVHFRDTAADMLVYVPYEGLAPEVVELAALTAVAELLELAEGLLKKVDCLIEPLLKKFRRD
jgi:hypothetical protein